MRTRHNRATRAGNCRVTVVGITFVAWRLAYGRVTMRAFIETGGFWSGNRNQFDFGLTLRPVSGINLTAEYTYTDVSLDEGSFSTNLLRFDGSFDFTPFVSFSSIIQYDDLSDRLGINNRFRWIITPGTDLFLVYNHNWVEQNSEFITAENTATLKVTYTHRF